MLYFRMLTRVPILPCSNVSSNSVLIARCRPSLKFYVNLSNVSQQRVTRPVVRIDAPEIPTLCVRMILWMHLGKLKCTLHITHFINSQKAISTWNKSLSAERNIFYFQFIFILPLHFHVGFFILLYDEAISFTYG